MFLAAEAARAVGVQGARGVRKMCVRGRLVDAASGRRTLLLKGQNA